ncbi:HHR053Cp [Eremothecium sinecaudum]|uniref:HHR053Cp n=1 Tax=Eremothecium sinecaudum TaxID=45286 RepID=A0A0X8HWI8_9SACH|nr:HHR053Cp [Eremothecium sinecaudum]AMD22822.1 HHR053Cp [Eremothecium sinecaudum]
MSTKLLFCKSEVFVHAAKNAKDHRTGVLVITNDPQQSPHNATITWLDKEEIPDKLYIYLQDTEIKLANGIKIGAKIPKDVVIQAMYSSWSFSVKLHQITSIQFCPPSPNGWFHGSVIIQSKDSSDNIPVLHMHDDVCPSTQIKSKFLVDSFQPFKTDSDVYWGGTDLKEALSELTDLKASSLDSTLYVLNSAQVQTYSKALDRRGARANPGGSNGDGVNNGTESWNKLQSYSWNTMATIATATTKFSSLVGTLIKKHPIVQFAERNSNNPYVRRLLDNPSVQAVQRDFDSANVYLAKWSLGVKEQAEKYREYGSNDTHRQLLFREFGTEGDFEITPDELKTATERLLPLTATKWNSFFDGRGRLFLSEHEIKSKIFHGGIESMDLRREVWPFLLGVFPWNSSRKERESIENSLRERYENDYKAKWLNIGDSMDAKESEYWQDQIFRIEKDVKRTDRNYEFYKYNTEDGKRPTDADKSDHTNTAATVYDNEIDDQEIKNPNILALKTILACFNLYNDRLGYVQGMSDLLSPIYFVLQDEAMAFWCFVHFMERMERNFLRDQSGIRDQMLTLSQLCQFMLPVFSEHLNKCDSSDFFFCFRMILVWFKREFEFDDVCSIWEMFWTDHYTSQFHLFFMLAIFQKNSKPVVDYLTQFDQVLKYFNDLTGRMDWKDLAVRAELLFIHFKRAITIFDKVPTGPERTVATGYQQHANENDDGDADAKGTTPDVIRNLSTLLSTRPIIKTECERTADSIK